VCSSSAELAELATLVGGRPEAAKLERVIVGIEPASPDSGARSSVRAELELGETTTVCLFAGSLEPRKEPLLAARAVLEARSSGADVALLVAGDGPLRAELEALAGETVRTLGFRDDLGRLMAASDLFVMPSTREGLPLALLEAMGHGLVPVVAREPGSVEAIGDAGVSVPAGDVGALANAFAELARDGSRRRRLGEAARERREREFELDRFLGEMDAVYRRALE
jgi:glycosyltransferase involved in cell wall biosynthesis